MNNQMVGQVTSYKDLGIYIGLWWTVLCVGLKCCVIRLSVDPVICADLALALIAVPSVHEYFILLTCFRIIHVECTLLMLVRPTTPPPAAIPMDKRVFFL